MNKIYLIISIFLCSHLSAQIAVDSVRYKYALKTPKTKDVKYLARFLRAGVTKSEGKTVETFFYWIAQNIEYDFELSQKKDISLDDVSVKRTLETKKTICAGYSKLLFELCEAVNIDCVIIDGIAQDFFGNNSEGHSWNAVKINDKWLLVDSTWGAGGLNSSNEFEKQLDFRYFFADPNFMIIDHLPTNKEWQLIENKVTIEKFIGKEWQEKRSRKFNEVLE